jgi:N-methylhydantoinase A
VSVWVGVDVGGTFTDLVAIDRRGRIETRKVLSTPADQSEAVLDALRALGAPRIERFVHGTTVATNMLLERRGTEVALCATRGFTDLLYLRRQNRASLYDLAADHAPPLAPAHHTIGVPERIEPQGVTVPLTPQAARAVAEALATLTPAPAVAAVVLLHSYRDPAHERLLRDVIRERLPGLDVVLSSDVYPEVREYERAATTVAEAYLRPGVARYLQNLGGRLARDASVARAGVMTSNGGMRSIDEAAEGAARLALSGPAGGVVGAAAVARDLRIARALTIDIGGTSADAGLVLDGRPLVEPGGLVAGVPIAMPRVLVETVSAGGGSIAWVDDAGGLRVGPRSAGAVPGPVAFGRGGAQPTVTDAHVVLGRIMQSRMSGGVTLDVEAAVDSVARLARRLKDKPERVAAAIIATADATMARALRRVSVERGVDPRGCTLIAFGGGGPLHACGLAEALGARRVIVPPFAGVLSALGLAMTPERREGMTSVMRRLADWDDGDRRALLEQLAAAMPKELARRGWIARMRYAGQGHELDVPIFPRQTARAIATAFTAAHDARYGFALAGAIEVVSVRVVAEGTGRAVQLGRLGRRKTGSPIRGPRSVILPDATLFVARGWTAAMIGGNYWELQNR